MTSPLDDRRTDDERFTGTEDDMMEQIEIGTAVAERPDEVALPSAPVDMSRLMSLAESGVDPDTIGKMVDLYERVHGIQAEQAFNQAMLAIQTHMDGHPVPTRGQVVVNKAGTTKPYPFLEDIQRALAPVCAQHGMSYSFDTRADGKGFTIVTRVSHVMGVTRETHTTLPLDESGSKNKVQGVGSTESYGMRYGLIKAFGLARYLHDDDGSGSGGSAPTDQIDEETVEQLKAHAAEVGLNAERTAKMLAIFDAETWADLTEGNVAAVRNMLNTVRAK